MTKTPALWLVAVLSLCALALTVCLCSLIQTTERTVAAVPGEIAATRAALVAQGDALRVQSLLEIDKQATGLRIAGTAQLNAIRTESLARIDTLTSTADRQITSSRADLEVSLLRSLNMLVEPLNGIRADLQPVLASSKDLLDTYEALPAQAASSPAWLALQPEITCRQLDGSGYGGCWHSRITGLMGEAVRVGGVFTQHFPSMVSSLDGIGVDVHTATHKFVAPTSTKTKIWDGFKSMALIASHF